MTEQEGRNKRVISLVDANQKPKWKRAVRGPRQEGSSIYNVKWLRDKRRVGRPRTNWTEEGIEEIWDRAKHSRIKYRYEPFDENNNDIDEMIKNFEVTKETCAPPPPALAHSPLPLRGQALGHVLCTCKGVVFDQSTYHSFDLFVAPY